MKKIAIIIGTRPNFIKVTRFKELASDYGFEVKIIHTGQHFDKQMSEVFFDQFGLKPDVFLNAPQSTQIGQIAEIMKSIETELSKDKPDLVLVPGDVNSTFAGAFVAQRLGIKLGHIESGLRSRDMNMPEEVNRILTDKITNLFFVTEKSGEENLLDEGVPAEQIHFVGNTMIDTLVKYSDSVSNSQVLGRLNIRSEYALMTLHRPSNVDDAQALETSVDVINKIAEQIHLVLPLHPRTKKALDRHGLLLSIESNDAITLGPPMGYFDFQKLIANAKMVITDSGGIQEETSFMQVPCITLRQNTERPVTIELGSNVLMDMDADKIVDAITQIKDGNWKSSQVPPKWDGKSTERILEAIQADLA